MANYIVTVTTADQVGIIHCVTGTLRERMGNVVELSQTVMRGYFTIILEVAFERPIDPKVLQQDIEEQGRRFHLFVQVMPTESLKRQASGAGERFILTVLGDDSPGIIHGITGCLADHGVNIVDLHARSEAGRFSLVMEVFLPTDLPPGTIREALERYGRDQGLEAFVQHENIFSATSEPSPVRVGVARARNPMTTDGSSTLAPH